MSRAMDKIRQTRANFDLRILEMIQTVLKIDAVAEVIKVFEAAEQGDKAAQAKIDEAGIGGKAPSGFMVKDLGIVDKETCDALLTAQAAERTLRVMEEIDLFYDMQVPGIMIAAIRAKKSAKGGMDDLMMYSPSTEAVKKYYDKNVVPAVTETPAFKFIGSAGDPESLVCAQATHQLAVEYERNEKLGIKEKMIAQFMKVPDFEDFGREYQEGFRAHAAASYQAAAQILSDKGYKDVASEMIQVSEAIIFDKKVAEKHMPERFSKKMIFSQNGLVMAANTILDPMKVRDVPYWGVNEEYRELLTKRGEQSLRCA